MYKPNSPLPPQIVLGQCFITATEMQTRTVTGIILLAI